MYGQGLLPKNKAFYSPETQHGRQVRKVYWFYLLSPITIIYRSNKLLLREFYILVCIKFCFGLLYKIWHFRFWIDSQRERDLDPLQSQSPYDKENILVLQTGQSGLEKNLNSSLPFGQVALKFCLPWASFGLLFLQFTVVGRWLAWALAHWASENEKWLAQQENLLVLDNRTALFSSPVKENFLMGNQPNPCIFQLRCIWVIYHGFVLSFFCDWSVTVVLVWCNSNKNSSVILPLHSSLENVVWPALLLLVFISANDSRQYQPSVINIRFFCDPIITIEANYWGHSLVVFPIIIICDYIYSTKMTCCHVIIWKPISVMHNQSLLHICSSCFINVLTLMYM